MINRIRRHFIVAMALVGVLGFASLVVPSTAYADHADKHSCSTKFLTFPAWFDGLVDKTTCQIAQPDAGKDGEGLSKFIFTIALNIIEILLQLIAYAAVGYIIYGGFKYLTSAGSADRITAGRKIITNALIGLVISFMSIAVVNLVTGGIATTGNTDCAAPTNGQIDPDCVGIVKVDSQAGIEGVLNAAYYVAGAAAIIVIIVSAIFYIISQGDAAKIKRAKDGILYAVVGLVVILLAFVITNFVIGRF